MNRRGRRIDVRVLASGLSAAGGAATGIILTMEDLDGGAVDGRADGAVDLRVDGALDGRTPTG